MASVKTELLCLISSCGKKLKSPSDNTSAPNFKDTAYVHTLTNLYYTISHTTSLSRLLYLIIGYYTSAHVGMVDI